VFLVPGLCGSVWERTTLEPLPRLAMQAKHVFLTIRQAEPGLCDKGQFDYFLTIRFLGFSFLQSVGLLRFAPNGKDSDPASLPPWRKQYN